MAIYLIKRGPRPEHHNAPFHPVILCTRKGVAKWEAGSTRDGATVWERENDPYCGWWIQRWKGFDIDYGAVANVVTFPDGTEGCVYHDRDAEPWTLHNGAIWWSNQPIPAWLAEQGVVYAPDGFSRNQIMDAYRPIRGKIGSFAGFEISGINRASDYPSFWPPVDQEKERELSRWERLAKWEGAT